MATHHTTRYNAVVIGGGQAGLAAAYCLANAGQTLTVLDAHQRAGEAWRRRWDSLRLFSPAQYDGLPGLPFPAANGTFPTKDEMAAYLEYYVDHFALPVEYGVEVTHVRLHDGGFLVECNDRCLLADNVVVATGAYSRPRIPDFARELRSEIQQLDATTYRRPSDVAANSVLVVGFGTSGADIARELSVSGREVRIAGRPTVQILAKLVPALFEGATPLRRLAGKAYWGYLHHVLTIDTPLGRKAGAVIASRGQPLIRYSAADVVGVGVEAVGRVAGTAEGYPQLDDGRIISVASIVWCTGFRSDYSWLDLPALRFDDKGWPVAPHGIAPDAPGVYFMGLPFQSGVTSTLVGGMARDAKRIVQHLVARNGHATRESGITAPSRGREVSRHRDAPRTVHAPPTAVAGRD